MEEIHYKVLNYIDNTRGNWTPPDRIKVELDEEDDSDVDDALNYLKKNSFIREGNDRRYRILQRGVELLATQELNNSIDDLQESISSLKDFQSKSSAVETIFTLFLLGFAYLQYSQQTTDLTGGTIFVVTGILWALLIGGRNMWMVTGEKLSKAL